MATKLTSREATGPEARPACAPGHRSIAYVELITTAALALSTAVAVTAVSIGIARADAISSAIKGDGETFALLIGLLLAALSGLTTLAAVGTRLD
jgi:hypothetical protein